MFCFSLDGMLSTQAVHGQVSSPLAVMEGDVPGTLFQMRHVKQKKGMILFIQ